MPTTQSSTLGTQGPVPINQDSTADKPTPIPKCRHIKEDGIFCQNPAVHGQRYCYAHLRARGRQMRMAREARKQRMRPLVFPPLEDLDAVQVCIHEVLCARGAERIGDSTMKGMLWGLHLAANNLKFKARMAATTETAGEQPERAVEYPTFEAEFGLSSDVDLEQPPETQFPPEAAADTAADAADGAGPDRPPAPELNPDTVQFVNFHNPESLVTPEDVELEELFERQGHKAWKERFDEIEAKRKQQVRKVDEARWLLEATRRNDKILREGDPRVREYIEGMTAEYRKMLKEAGVEPKRPQSAILFEPLEVHEGS